MDQSSRPTAAYRDAQKNQQCLIFKCTDNDNLAFKSKFSEICLSLAYRNAVLYFIFCGIKAKIW